MSMSHAERAKRRREIAAYCRTHSLDEAAREFGVCQGKVRVACSEHGVTPLRDSAPHVRDGHLQLIAELLKSRSSYASIARRRGLTRQAVAQLASRCDAAGIPVAARQ